MEGTVKTRYGDLLPCDAVVIAEWESGTWKKNGYSLEFMIKMDSAISRISHGSYYDKFTLVYYPPGFAKKTKRTVEIRGPLTCNLTVQCEDDYLSNERVVNMLTYFVLDKRSREFSRRCVPIRNIYSIDDKVIADWFPVDEQLDPVFWSKKPDEPEYNFGIVKEEEKKESQWNYTEARW